MFRVAPEGLQLHVCQWGKEQGHATVILHGFLDQAAAWGNIAHRLDRWVQAPDQRGHGESEHVPPGGFYHFWDYVADLDALLADLQQPVDLIGHSMGGSVAVLFTACRPGKVRRLVLVEGLGPPDASDQRVKQAQTFLQHRRTPPRHLSMSGLDAVTQRLMRHTPSLPEPSARFLAQRLASPTPKGEWNWRWDALHRCRNPRVFETSAFQDFLEAIQCPTLVIEGAKSAVTLPDREARLRALQPSQVVTLEDAGHQIHHDAPLALSEAIRNFLDGGGHGRQ